MRNTTKLVSFHRYGNPSEVLKLEELDLPLLQNNQVLVEMKAAPVHPADFNSIKGTYGRRSPLPAIAGHEGIGIIIDVGRGVKEFHIGQQVRPRPGIGTWREALVAEPKHLVPIPPGLSDEQASVLSVNPGTAWRLLKDFVELKPGDWILQNAANSSVGRFVIQLARHFGFRTINLVRREELFDELKEEGADIVLLTHRDVAKSIREQTHGEPIRLGLNAVGGLSALQIAKCLGVGGTLVTYGAMARKPLTIPNGLLIFKELRCVGFWMTAWYERTQPTEVESMFRKLAPLFINGTLKETIEARYDIAQFQDAIIHAQRERRQGKVMLVLNPQ